jgi:hypothetical protein
VAAEFAEKICWMTRRPGLKNTISLEKSLIIMIIRIIIIIIIIIVIIISTIVKIIIINLI